MKKLLLLLSSSSFIFSVAQVGINTANPQAILHVDGAKDNSTSGAPSASQQANDFVVTSSGNVGVGTASPNSSAIMELNTSNKGFLPPRISLQSTTDAATITNPATGLIVYNTNASITNGTGVGLYFNSGTSASPVWAAVSYTNTTSGSTTTKIVYSSATGVITNSVKLGDFEFSISSGNVPQFRLINAPSANVIADWNLMEAYSPSRQDFFTKTATFTPSDYNTYRSFSNSTNDSLTNSGEINTMYLTIRGAANPSAYRVTFFEQGSTSPYTWVIWAEKI
ncbi:hypothetical protein [Chryseobacterium sp. CT-SW4]|uniref:hypothetical protein n=1 Tax=Chryseobacterium sp. SW-1 TaxID=3157343 RepID=UPI003B01C85B